MKLKFKLAAAFSAASLCLLAGAAQAQILQLPPNNEMSSAVYGDFTVYSLDLLEQCAAAGDPRCLPSGPYPVQSSAGQIASYLLITQGTSTGDNYPPLVPPPTGDNAFDTPTGNSNDPHVDFNMTAANEPIPNGFTGDQTGTWEVQLGTLVQYLTDPLTGQIGDLVFLFGNNQDGAGPDQFQYIFATGSVRTEAGAFQTCYAVFANTYGGTCDAPVPVEPTYDANGFLSNPGTTSFVTMATDFCVDKTTGVSYNIGFAGNDNDCAPDGAHPAGGYYVSNNLGNNNAEFAAYNQALQDFILANYVAHPEWVLSVNVMMRNLTDGGEDIWICTRCNLSTTTQVPEPGTLALAGLVLAGLGFLRRRRVW